MTETCGVQIRPILLLWEKLRIVYNLALACVTGLMLALDSSPLSNPAFPLFLFKCCIAANICYTAGPALDAYVNYVAGRRVRLTWVLFGVGTAMSVMFAFAMMLGFLMKDWD